MWRFTYLTRPLGSVCTDNYSQFNCQRILNSLSEKISICVRAWRKMSCSQCSPFFLHDFLNIFRKISNHLTLVHFIKKFFHLEVPFLNFFRFVQLQQRVQFHCLHAPKAHGVRGGLGSIFVNALWTSSPSLNWIAGRKGRKPSLWAVQNVFTFFKHIFRNRVSFKSGFENIYSVVDD